MQLDKLKGLPLTERIAEFRKIREKFALEKSKLNEIIGKLEAAIKEREAFAENLSAPERKTIKNEVRALAASIKNVRLRVDAKTEELKLVEQALSEAEHQIAQDEKTLAAFQKSEKNKLEMMITELNKTNQTEEIRLLEEEIKQAEIPEEVKKELEQSADYMQRQNDNFYKAQASKMLEEMNQGYDSKKQEEERGAVQTFYETDEKGRRKIKEHDYKA
jgi:hypothetical protein